jgi:hypothetical protein
MFFLTFAARLEMLQYVQNLHYTPTCRAGTFFAGLGLLCSQVFVNMTQVSSNLSPSNCSQYS